MTEGPEIIQLMRLVRCQRKPRLLYHYTSGHGLIGILQSRCIWATSIRFLNDSTEYDLALELARKSIRFRVQSVHSRYEEGLFSVMEEGLNGAAPAEVYVSSFSENADQLSQWRAYCPSTGGCAIGFASGSLVQKGTANPGRFLARCSYESSEHERLISDLLDAVVAFAEHSRRAGLAHDRVYRESYKLLGRMLTLLAPTLKDPSFAEEQEWRLVCNETSFGDASRQFRMGRSMLVPYYEHSFPNQPESAPIGELVIGPTPHPKLACEAAQCFLLSRGLPSTTVRSSVIPYRAW